MWDDIKSLAKIKCSIVRSFSFLHTCHGWPPDCTGTSCSCQISSNPFLKFDLVTTVISRRNKIEPTTA